MSDKLPSPNQILGGNKLPSPNEVLGSSLKKKVESQSQLEEASTSLDISDNQGDQPLGSSGDGDVYTYNGKKYKKKGNDWLKETNGKYVPITAGNVAQREEILNTKAKKVVDRWANVTETKSEGKPIYKTDDYIDVVQSKDYIGASKPAYDQAYQMMKEDFGVKEFEAYNKIDGIDLDLIANTEEYTVAELNKRFKGSGLYFEETGLGDQMRVLSTPDGGLTTTNEGVFNLYPKNYTGQSGIPTFDVASAEAEQKRLKEFLNNSLLKKSEKEYIQSDNIKSYGDLVKLQVENPRKYGENFLDEQSTTNWIDNQYLDLAIETKSLKREQDALNKEIQQYKGREIPIDVKKKFESRINILTDKKESLISTHGELTNIQTGLKEATGYYYDANEKKGNIAGVIGRNFVKGLMNLPKMEMDLVADAVPFIFGENATSSVQRTKMEAAGMSDTEINNTLTRDLKESVNKKAVKSLQDIASFGTTEEYAQSEDRNDLEKVAGFLAESVGTGLSAGGNTTLSKLAFFAQSYNAMEDQMNSKEFDDLNIAEKKLMSVPYGIAIGFLERLGFKATTGGSKLLSGVVTKSIARALTQVPKDASLALMKSAINKSVIATMAESGLSIVAGSFVEGSVEATQNTTEIGAKQLFNYLEGQEYFKDVPDLTTKEGMSKAVSMASEDFYYGMLGGIVMASGSEAVSAVKNGYSNKKQDESFDLFYNSITNDNLRNTVKTEIKSNLVTGKITKEEADAQMESVGKAYSVFKSIPDNLPTKDKRESFNLIVEKQTLEKEIEGKDPSLVDAQKKRVSEINESLKTISNNATKKTTEQQQGSQAEGGISQYQGAGEGQQKDGNAEGGQREAKVNEADSGDSTIPSKVQEEVEKLRADEQAELLKEIPKIESYKVNGELDKTLMPKTVLSKYNKIYNKYDKLISPLLETTTEIKIDKPAITTNTTAEVDRVKSLTEGVEDGATFNLDGKKYDGPGLVVPVISMNTTSDKLTPEMISNFVEEHTDKIGDSETVKVGIYKFPNSNQVSIDLNILAPESSRDQAIEFGKMSGQESLFDMSTYENVKTGATGENPMQFTPQQFKEIAKALKEGRSPNVFGVKESIPKVETKKVNYKQNLVTAENSTQVASRQDTPIRQNIAKSVKLITKALPGVKVYLHNNESEMWQALADATDMSLYQVFRQVGYSAGSQVKGEIHINMQTAKANTLMHEAFHEAILRSGKSAKTITGFANGLKNIISNKDIKARLDMFVSMYEESDQSEEFLSELGAIMAEAETELTTTKLQQFLNLINRIAKSLGLPVILKSTATKQEAVDFINTIAKSLRTGEEVENIITDGIQLNIVNPTGIKKQVKIKNDYKLSFVKKEDIIDIEELIKNISKSGQKVWFWMADQLGRGYVFDEVSGEEHYLDAGPSFALDPKNRSKRIIWASGKTTKDIQKQIDNSDYIFLVSGNPETAKLFNKAVFDLYAKKLGDYNLFKKEVLSNKPKKGISEILNAHDSWETLREDSSVDNLKKGKIGTGRKKFLMELNNVANKPGATLNKILKDKNAIIDINSIRDDFYADNGFNQNDIMLVLKAEKLGGKSAHSTYENDLIGDVVGVPDKKINAYDILSDQDKARYIDVSNSDRNKQQSITAPYGSGIREVQPSKIKQQKNNLPENVSERLTETKDGKIVFHHYSKEKRDVIKPMVNQASFNSSKEEIRAINSVGGVSFWYTMANQKEALGADELHTVLVPKEKVYYLQKDVDGFYDEAKRQFNEVRPGQAFDDNYQAAWIGKVAQDNGYDILVSEWRNGELRAQSTKDIKPEGGNTEFKERVKDTYKVGEKAMIYGRESTITKVDGNILTYEGSGTSGTFDVKSPFNARSIKKIRLQKTAPNGKPSKLNDVQWEQVRTPAFKRWFGDWENDPKNASKIVDSNGEPMSVYHGTTEDFEIFMGGSYFTDDYMNADGYASGEIVLETFLNIKNPLIIDSKGRKWDDLQSKYGSSTREIVGNLDEKIYDGVAFNNINDNWFDDEEGEPQNVYYTLEPNQVKLADGTNTTFDATKSSIKLQKNNTLKEKGISDESIKTIESNYEKEFGFYDLDWNKESDRKDFENWFNNFTNNQFDKNISKVINLIKDDIDLLNKRQIINEKLKAFEELIIPSLGKDILTKQLSKYEQMVIMDPNATTESIQKGFEEAKNILDKEGNLDKLKITDSPLFKGGEINLPAFERFVEKNPEFIGVFNDWKKILDESNDLSLKQTNAFRYPSLKSLNKLYDELNDIKDNSKKIKLQKTPQETRMDNESENVFKKSLDRGTNWATATQDALDYIQKSKWYQDATDIDREQKIRDFKQSKNQKIKKAPSVAKVLGAPKPNMVTVNEMTAFKDQLRKEAKAAREAKADLNLKRKSLGNAIKGMVKLGKLKATQAVTIIKRVSQVNLDNPVMVERLIDYASRVFERADYQERLDRAFSYRRAIRRLLKSDNQAQVIGMANQFTKIDPSMVENIDEYIAMAEIVKNAVAPSRAKKFTLDKENYFDTDSAKGFDMVLRQAANIETVSNFIKDVLEKQEQKLKDELLATNNDLLESGVISADMTAKEIQEIVNAMKDPEYKMDSLEKEKYMRAYLSNRFESLASIVTDIVKTKKNPVTGENVAIDQKDIDIISDLLKVDLSEMSIRDAVFAVEAMDNFITNGITSKLEGVLASYKGQLGLKNEIKSGKVAKALKLYFSKKLGRYFGTEFTPLPLMIERMFSGVTSGISVMKSMGLDVVINGVNRANKIHEKVINDYYEKFIKKSKTFHNPENVYERGMLSFLKRNVTGSLEEMNAETSRRIKMIEESINTLMSEGDETQKAMAEIYQKVFDKLGVSTGDIDVINSRASKENRDAVDWWINEWSKNYKDLADVSLSVYNYDLGSDLNYTPDRYKTIKTEAFDQKLIERNSSFLISMDHITDKGQTGVLMQANRPKVMPDGRYISLDFDSNNSNSLKGALVDINTAAGIRQVDGFLNSKLLSKLIPTSEDRDVLIQRTNRYIRRAKGKIFIPSDLYKDVDAVLNFAAGIGATKALGGVLQSVKQTIPIALSTAINTGKFNVAGVAFNEWLNKTGMPISNRGTESLSTIESIDRRMEAKGTRIKDSLKTIQQIQQIYLKFFLSRPDVFIARSGFESYYLQYMGEKSVDWANHEANQDALNYAQSMVDRQQNVSDPMLGGEFLTAEDGMKRMAKKVLFPFASFALNQKARLNSDIINLASKTTSEQDKKIARKSAVATVAEMVAYRAISVAIGYSFYKAAQMIVNSFVGPDDDEEKDQDKKWLMSASKFPIKSMITDFASPIQMSDKYVTMGTDFLFSLVTGDTKSELDESVKQENEVRALKDQDPMTPNQEEDFRQKLLDKSTFRVGSPYDENTGLGMVSIASDLYTKIYDDYTLAATGEFEDEYKGNKTTKKIRPVEQDLMKNTLMFSALYAAGILPKESDQIVTKVVNMIKKNAMSESEYEKYSEFKTEFKREPNPFEMGMIKSEKKYQYISDDVNWVNTKGGLTLSQGREYVKIINTLGEVDNSTLLEIKAGKTADQIVKSMRAKL